MGNTANCQFTCSPQPSSKFSLLQLSQLQTHTNELLIRLEEFEALATSVEKDASDAQQNVQSLVSRKEELLQLCKRIDKIEHFIEIVDQNVSSVARQVEIAAEELGLSDGSTISSLFKSVFTRNRQQKKETNCDASGNFVPAAIFKTSDFFEGQEDEAGGSGDDPELGIELGELNEEFLE